MLSGKGAPHRLEDLTLGTPLHVLKQGSVAHTWDLGTKEVEMDKSPRNKPASQPSLPGELQGQRSPVSKMR